ncbi:hypothetical protein C2S52_004080 [Perilla frutescens var. hirtella]|nr:hypothetical protein C2S52_004080 [Perilla frutescens var. hirtella]
MKQNIHSIALLLILVFLLISTSHTSSRKLASKQGGAHLMIKSKKSVTEMENIESFHDLMGVEECENEDEECLKRRILADAHLDYIYTQDHKH